MALHIETPLIHSHPLSAAAGRRVRLKLEALQPPGSFKIRGAYHRLSRLPAGTHVVAGSAGNHAQGVALAAHLLGHRATIYMPVSASIRSPLSEIVSRFARIVPSFAAIAAFIHCLTLHLEE